MRNYLANFIFILLILTSACAKKTTKPFTELNITKNLITTKSNSISLMPWPKYISQTSSRINISRDFTISINNKKGRAYHGGINFLRRLANRTGLFINKGFPVINDKEATVQVSFDKIAVLQLGVDESYSIITNKNAIIINASTDVGAIRGIETLLQLLQSDKDSYYFLGVNINDAPRFLWRGLMIDASRHFESVGVIKRNLDAMAAVKLNTFHWHLTDDQGIRISSKAYPKLQELASDGQYYTHDQIRDVVAYADALGIRIIPEIDVPAHATTFLVAYPELGSKSGSRYEIQRFAGQFNPTLDPSNEDVYTFLDILFGELTPLFPDQYFHIGGDENAGVDWNKNEKIQKFKSKHGLVSNHDLQTYFNVRLEKILQKYGKKLMGWDEIMTDDMPKSAIIHSWRGIHEGIPKGTLIEAAKKGFSTVLSNGFYIDRMQSVEDHYLIEPIGEEVLTKEETARILGGVATMWGELVTPLTIDSRIWPRTAAIAERLWSSKEIVDVEDMRRRLKIISHQLEELGITHIKNKDVILRNISNNQDIASIRLLTDICEPLKIYSRNAGGTEYKSFSPFTLFADVCTADAEDAYVFNKLVDTHTSNPTVQSKYHILNYLKKWQSGFKAFNELKMNPKMSEISVLYKNLNEISSLIEKTMKKKTVIHKEQIEVLLEMLKKPYADTELVIVKGLEKLTK